MPVFRIEGEITYTIEILADTKREARRIIDLMAYSRLFAEADKKEDKIKSITYVCDSYLL